MIITKISKFRPGLIPFTLVVLASLWGFLNFIAPLNLNLWYMLAGLLLSLMLVWIWAGFLLVVAVLSGVILGQYCFDSAFATRLPQQYNSKDIVITGTVATIPKANTRAQKFIFRVEKTDFKDINIRKIRLNYYGKDFRFKAGDRWRLKVRLKYPHGFFNNAGFDYEKWLLQSRIDASGYIRPDSSEFLGVSDRFLDKVNILREHIGTEVLAGFENKALLRALLTGDKSSLDATFWKTLRHTGTNHMLAISGLHLGLVSLMIWVLFRTILIWSPVVYLQTHAHKIAALIALISAVWYALLTGFSIPTQRALVMIAVVVISIITMRTTQAYYVLALSMLVCLVFDPLSVLAVGFWLSFVAVFWLITIARLYNLNWVLSLMVAQLILGLALLPILASSGFGISAVSLPANLVSLPVVSFVVLPGLLLGFIQTMSGLGEQILSITDWSLGLLWDYLKFIGRFDLIWLPAPGLVEILATVTGLVLLLLPLRFPLKSLGVLLLLGSFIPKFNQIDKGVAHITVLDVGQGLSVLVQTQNHKLLFDTGAKYPESEGLFKMAVLPVLIDNNIASLDRFIISHADNDHSGGYQDAIESMRIRDILSSSPDKFAASRACRPQSWRWDQVQFDILHPGVEGKFKGNNSSCVVKITTSGASFLLLSDLESRGEKALMENADIRADAFLVGHHGSKTSSTPELLAKLKAKYAVISAGFYNRYHHPHPSVIKMLKHFDLQIFNTAKSGALEIIAGDGINIREYRREYGKPWHIYPAD